jgi:hypothetical protein
MRNLLYVMALMEGMACSVPDVTFTNLCPFTTAPKVPTGRTPMSIAVADIDGDQHMDLVVANQDDNTVGVFLGHGDGTFALQVPFNTRMATDSIAVGDINGDGRRDIAVASSKDSSVNVLINNSTQNNPAFQLGPPMLTSGSPESIALGDLDDADADQTLDVVVPLFGNGGKVKVFHYDKVTGLSNAQPPYMTPQASSPWGIAVAQLNKTDSHLDLAVANRDLRTVTVFLGNGNGTFPEIGTDNPMETTDVKGAIAIATVDINGSNGPDVVVVDYTSDSVSVRLNNGSGSFGPPMRYQTGAHPQSVAAASLAGDGKPYVVVANQGDNTVSVFRGNADANDPLTLEGICRTGKSPQAVAIADVNGDGHLDLIVANSGENTLSVLLAPPPP